MENESFVLGGGITGLTAGYILNVPVVTSDVGGQLSKSFPLGPRYIHSTEETREFVNSLGLNVDEKTVKVGYFYNNTYHSRLPKHLIAEYSVKTRGTVDVSASIGRNSFRALKVTFDDVIKKLLQKVEIHVDKIYKISKNVMYGMNRTYKFKQLISTIPLPSLYALYGVHIPFNYVPVGYCFSNFDESFFFAETFGDFNYVYFPERKYPYYRVTKVDGGFVYEFTYNYKIKYPKGMIWQEFGKILPACRLLEVM